MRVIPGHPNYSITKSGRVWSRRRHKFLQQWLQRGYPTVQLGRTPKKLVHCLVLETYVGPCPDGMEACHNDGNRINICVSNLRWDTRSNNQKDAVRHGTQSGLKNKGHTRSRGEQSGMAKLTESIVLLIRQLWNIRWMGVKRYELAEMFNVSGATVGKVISRKTWKYI